MSILRKGLLSAVSTITMMALPLTHIPAMAMEGGTEAIGSVMLPTIKEQIISVDLPTVGDESPFDFYIDPQGLLYDTGAVRHGGGVVEEGAYLLFHNHDDSAYDFSRYSDRLSVTNRSTVPVNVKITARISDLGDLRMDQDGDFYDEDDPAIFLAIVDDEGNEQVLSEDGEVSVEIELSRAPSEAYTYRYDESSDSYEYVYQNDGDISFDSYSFGLRGECNANADWRGVSAYPRVMVTWTVDPIYPDDDYLEDYDREDEDSEETEEELVQNEEEASDENAEDVTDDSEESSSEDENKNEPATGDDNDDGNNTDPAPAGDKESDVDNTTEPETDGGINDTGNADTNASDSGETITGKETEQNETQQDQRTSDSDGAGTVGGSGEEGDKDA